jgi:hypothetical protein
MTSRSQIFPKSLALACVLTLVALLLGGSGCGGSENANNSAATRTPMPTPTTTALDCTQDRLVVRNKIYDELKVKGYGTEFWQLNIVVTTRKEIVIEGWSTQKTQIEGDIRAMLSGDCTMGPNPNFFATRADLVTAGLDVQHACNPPLVACGDVCVVECARPMPGLTSGSNTNAIPPNANTNVQMNSNRAVKTNTANKP